MAWPTNTISTTSMDQGTDDASQARADIKQMADNVNAMKDARGGPDGVAPLNGQQQVPVDHLPTTGAQKGGTGQTQYAIGDILIATSINGLTRLPAASNGHVLTSNGPGVAPSWKQSGGGLVSGTKMAFHQTAAPTGWTKLTTTNDAILRIVSGTVTTGGSTAFSTFNGQSSTGGRTLSLNDLPNFTIKIPGVNFNASPGGAFGSKNVLAPGPLKVSSDPVGGGGGSHSHSITRNIKYIDFILAVRD